MKKSFSIKAIVIFLVIATLMVSLPMTVFADAIQGEEEAEIYMKSIKVAQANTKEQAKSLLEAEGYIFLDRNLNEGTGAEGVWMGYTTTTDPNEAIYDIKLMNTDGGYTLTSMDAVYSAQESTFAQMATDLNYLIDEFVTAYNDGSVPAQKAYMALNFFRVVKNETELIEQNGLGYQIVNGDMTLEKLTNMILFCDGTIFDSVVKLLVMGVQMRSENWMEALQKKGPYVDGTSYGNDDAELKRRAKQLLVILQLYAQTYNAMDKMGLVSGTFDDWGNIVKDNDSTDNGDTVVAAEDADLVKADVDRVKSYKLVFDELAKYKYGNETMKDFFCSLENEKNEKVLYPLVSILTDGEFSALSYGCFIELALGANAKSADFENYDELFAELTKDVKSLFLYEGVNDVLLNSDTVIGFTDTASQHMALTGEYQFYEKESYGEYAWETGRFVALRIGSAGTAVMAGAKLTLGIMSLTGFLTAATAQGATGFAAGLAKICAALSGGYATLVVVAAAAVAAIVSYIVYIVDESKRNTVDWEANPIPEYIYDVQEVGFTGASKNDGIETDYVKRPVFVFYEAVHDTQNRAADLNARSGDSSRWIAMYVSYDRPGDGCKPIKASDFLVKTGNGDTPDGYVPVTRFGGAVSYNLNQWDETDTVNGIYMFYKQDQKVSMASDTAYYVYEVYLQTGESTAHCISLLEAAGYTPLNVNLSPSYRKGLLAQTPVFTYLGYKVTTNPNSAITDIRMEYGSEQGTVQLGGITYASCGNSAGVTLYATKYKAAGTPILASGLKCYNDRYEAETGYEPVNFLSGGPAQSFNTASGKGTVSTPDYFLYFLPETTFTDGETYLSGISYYYSDDAAFDCYYFQHSRNDNDEIILSYLKEKYPYEEISTDTKEGIKYAMACYMLGRVSAPGGYKVTHYRETDIFFTYYTYNPYRAIYSIKGTELSGIPDKLTVESQGYVSWFTMFWDGEYSSVGVGAGNVNYDLELLYNSLDMSGKYYVAGNPSKTNVYDPVNKTMTEQEPLIADYHLTLLDMTDEYDRETAYEAFMKSDYAYTPVSDIFSSSREPITITQKDEKTSEFVLFIAGTEEERPYVSSITAIDRLTLFREYGGSDAGLRRTDITSNMLLAHLASQGATNYADIQVSMHREIYALNAWNPFNDEYTDMNITRFGYTRTADADLALRDVFIYVAGFSTDDPPKTIQRGNVKYTLLCQLSGNLTGYEEAPEPGVYLYGTTDKKAGERIIDIDFTDTPFKDGYVTVRTMNGRSMWAELADYMTTQKNNHFMSGAKILYDALAKFFGFAREYGNQYYDNLRAQKYYYIHIKREGDDLRTLKPYIGNLYLSTGADDDKAGGAHLIRKGILDDLFDQGAEAFLDFDLNSNVGSFQYVYLGYSYTADPNDAITGIRPSHNQYWGNSVTLRANGITYNLVSDVTLNAGAGGDTIYLYYTKSHHEDAGKPITDIRYCQNSAPTYSTTDTAEILPVMRFDSWKPSNLNDGLNKGAIYLTVVRPFETLTGTYKAPNYGAEKTSTRKNATGTAEGKYLAALYVMDKNTIRQEKLAAGVPSDQCTCAKISDQEVFDRLKQMGATTVISTPLNITGGEYGKNNDNRVFIGYSRTDDYKKAIKNIAIKAELLSLAEPGATMEIGTISYNLVAEAATKVTKLPRAINLIGTQDGQDLLIPRLYLYTSTSGQGDPIYDVCIDGDPIKSGWTTVTSENKLEPFYDLYQQAKLQAELGDKDDDDSYDSEIVYTDELYKWMEDVAETFDPGEEEITPFFIHCKKRESNAAVSEVLPYISEIFVAAGDNKLDALSQLVAFAPDEYIDYDLNKGAGGDYIYLAYKRTNIKSEAITDIVVAGHDSNDRLWAGRTKDTTAPYDLVSHVNLNSGVINLAASNLYLYTSKSSNAGAGQPINGLYINNNQRASADKTGLWTEYTALKLLYDHFYEHYYPNRVYGAQHGDPDLNDGAGGNYIYLVMTRYHVAEEETSNAAGTLIGSGSIIAICVFVGISAIAAGAIVYVKRKKKE